jgi:hypothetical protein
MSPVISKRLKLQPGEDGKVALTFLWRDGGQSDIRRFSIRPAKEMEADIRFGMKHEEENTKMDMEEADDDPILGMQHLGKSLTDRIRKPRTNNSLHNRSFLRPSREAARTEHRL